MAVPETTLEKKPHAMVQLNVWHACCVAVFPHMRMVTSL